MKCHITKYHELEGFLTLEFLEVKMQRENYNETMWFAQLVELSDDAATVRGRNLVRVQQLLLFREHEVQQTFHLPNWCHVAKILLVVLGLHMAAFGLLWTFMWEEPVVEPELKRPDYSEVFPWLANL